MKEYKLTTKHQKIFFDKFEFWCSKLGLKGWEYTHKTLPASSNFASVDIYNVSRQIHVELSLQWDKEPTDKELEKCAQHEALEVMLARLRDMGTNTARKFTEDDVSEEIHNIIYTIMNVLM